MPVILTVEDTREDDVKVERRRAEVQGLGHVEHHGDGQRAATHADDPANEAAKVMRRKHIDR